MSTRLGIILASLILALSACGEGSQRAVDPGSGTTADELSAHEGEPCPEVLVDPDDAHGFGTGSPADRSPDLAPPDRAWVCVYQAQDHPTKEMSNGTYYAWTVSSEPTEVVDEDLAELGAAIETLTPAPDDRMCPADLGPRALVVTGRDGDLTAFAIDRFGCQDIRMSDDPHTNPPGVATQAGTVSGVLSSPTLAQFAQEYVDAVR